MILVVLLVACRNHDDAPPKPAIVAAPVPAIDATLTTGGWHSAAATQARRDGERSRDSSGHAVVAVGLKRDARRHFEELTTRIIGRKLAILVDGDVVSSTVITAPITSAYATIIVSDDRAARALAQRLPPLGAAAVD